MSGIDVLTKKFLSDHDRFAEIFNTFVFKGRQIVNSEKLSDVNPNEEFYDEKSRRTIERQRDILKLLELMMSDGKVGYLLLGAENQTEIHYSLPSRMMVYDGLLYSLQMEQHFEQKKKSKKKISGSEFLSRSVKDAKVHAVVTLVIYWGKEKWDAPLCLHEMMDIESAEPVRDVIPDFRINLLDMNDVPDEVIDTLQLSLKQVMYFRKYSDDRE
ncbi:MAG: Rpn family recombination-promoting nuclease/putative transposase, partial [Solobacterium sp.]|nr:Rpn family recombination-promoting nuclease/putative transposase [Solobacterium sp.]